MRFLYFSANNTDGSDPAKMTSVYEVAGQQVTIPADTDDSDIELAIVHALAEDLTSPMTMAEIRGILEADRVSKLNDILLDEILPFLVGRGFNPSAQLTGLLSLRAGIRNKFPDGQALPATRKKR